MTNDSSVLGYWAGSTTVCPGSLRATKTFLLGSQWPPSLSLALEPARCKPRQRQSIDPVLEDKPSSDIFHRRPISTPITLQPRTFPPKIFLLIYCLVECCEIRGLQKRAGRLRQGVPDLRVRRDLPLQCFDHCVGDPHSHFHTARHPGKGPVAGHTCLFGLICIQQVSHTGKFCHSGQLDSEGLRTDLTFSLSARYILQRGLQCVLSDISY